MTLSIVIPAYNEEESVAELFAQIASSADGLVASGRIDGWEALFVDDGSTDSTPLRLAELVRSDARVHVVTFRRNMGKSAALSAGFASVTGDVVITMDADLQDDPREFGRFLDKLDEGYDLVSGWKRIRHDPLEKRLPSRLFNVVTARASGIALHDFNCGFKAYRREVTECVRVYGELHRYIPLLAKRYGFTCGEVEVEHHAREHGRSKFGARRYLRGLLDLWAALYLMRYSDRPIYLFGKVGLALIALGVVVFVARMVTPGTLLVVAGIMSILLGLALYTVIDRLDDGMVRNATKSKS